MNKKLLAFVAVFSTFSAFAQIRMPQPSTTQTIMQEFGMGRIEVTYSRPQIKGRTYFANNSELAPYGQVWRTGANAATRIKFTDMVSVNGNKLDTGTYALYTIPGEKEWTIIINKGSKNWGTVYNEADDVVRFKVPAQKNKNANAETFAMQINDVQYESCSLDLTWGNTTVRVPITTEIRDRVRAQIETALANAQQKPYFQAANFYYDYDKNYAKALENVDKALAMDQNKEAFWIYLLKARIQKAAGDKAGAKATAQIAADKATAQKNDDYTRAAKELIKSM